MMTWISRSSGTFAFHEIEERPDIRGAMAGQALVDNPAGGDVECREQRGGAVPLVVVRVPLGLAGAHGQQRLGSVQRLDLRLFTNSEHQRAVGRIEVQADDVADLFHDQRSASPSPATAVISSWS